MAKGASVGFASSTIRAKASSTEKSKRRAAIPTTPAIEQAVAKIRNNGNEAQTRPLPTLPVGDSGLNSDTSIVTEMKAVRTRTLADYTVTSYRETPCEVEAVPVNGYVPFEGKGRVLSSYTTKRGTWFQVEAAGKRYIIGEWLVAGVVLPSPLPEKVVIIDTEPLLLMPPKIAGYLPSCTEMNYRTVAMVQRQHIRRQYEQETGEKLPEWKPLDLGQKWEWKNVPGKGWTKVKVG